MANSRKTRVWQLKIGELRRQFERVEVEGAEGILAWKNLKKTERIFLNSRFEEQGYRIRNKLKLRAA